MVTVAPGPAANAQSGTGSVGEVGNEQDKANKDPFGTEEPVTTAPPSALVMHDLSNPGRMAHKAQKPFSHTPTSIFFSSSERVARVSERLS
jgi:hypothetical protein